MFRAYCRFGILVMLSVSILAGFGIKFILENKKPGKLKAVIFISICGLILFEFWNYPPLKVIDVLRVPDAYYWIKRQPGDLLIAEYPMDSNSPNEKYKFYQTRHLKRIINCSTPGTYANKISKAIVRLSEPNTAGILKWLGVKYVLVHRQNYLRTDLLDNIEDLNKIDQNPGLKLIKSFSEQECPERDIQCVQSCGPIDLYEVTAMPLKPDLKPNG